METLGIVDIIGNRGKGQYIQFTKDLRQYGQQRLQRALLILCFVVVSSVSVVPFKLKTEK